MPRGVFVLRASGAYEKSLSVHPAPEFAFGAKHVELVLFHLHTSCSIIIADNKGHGDMSLVVPDRSAALIDQDSWLECQIIEALCVATE
jgi:hypothetical protein